MQTSETNQESTLLYVVTMFVVMAAGLMITGTAEAIVAPAAGSFAYDIYDVAVNSVLKGPIGFVAGIAAIVLGAINAIMGKIMMAFPAILGGAALIKADTIVTSMGQIF